MGPELHCTEIDFTHLSISNFRTDILIVALKFYRQVAKIIFHTIRKFYLHR